MILNNLSDQIAQRAEIDLNQLEVIKDRTSYVDQLRQGGQPAASALPPDQTAPGTVPSLPAERAPTGTGPVAPAPAIPPAAPAAPAAPASEIPPVLPGDSPRVQDRINRLYAQKRQGDEAVARLEQIIAEQNSRIDLLLSRQGAPQMGDAPPVPFTNQYGSSQNPTPPAGNYISRDELQRVLAAERQNFLALGVLNRAQDAARAEAARDFPDVFANPATREAYDRIVASDPALAADPYGPYKAAALARGLAGQAGVAPTQPSVDQRRMALNVPGVSNVERPAVPVDNEARFQAQLARARITQDPQDFLKARLIQLGQA